MNEQVDKGRLGALVNDLSERYGKSIVAQTLDALKEIGFYWATRSGVTVAISDFTCRTQGGCWPRPRRRREGRDPVPPRSTRRHRASS